MPSGARKTSAMMDLFPPAGFDLGRIGGGDVAEWPKAAAC
jgi:hypothetical protein